MDFELLKQYHKRVGKLKKCNKDNNKTTQGYVCQIKDLNNFMKIDILSLA